MNCRRVSSLISAYIDGELAGVEMLAIKRHISTCQACGEEFEAIRNVKRLMSRMSYVAPRENLAADICSRLDGYRISGYRRLWNSIMSYGRMHISPSLTAIGAVGAALILMTAGSTDKRPQPTMSAAVRAPAVTIRPVSDAGLNRLEMATVEENSVVPTPQSSWFIATSYPAR